jgi:PiT family inorganic phosphate transporter
MSLLLFLSSGIFLGWSLGANDAANIFGTAVGSRMISFKKAAIISSIFVILGAIISGSGAASTLGKLGSVNALAGAFVVALAAAVTVYGMTRLKLPVSTSQAIVGAIIGWNIYSGSLTNLNSFKDIIATWIFCPVLAGIIAVILYVLSRFIKQKIPIHMLYLDAFVRYFLIIAGAFGAYSLGANNIANVMGVFVSVSPFKPFTFDFISISSTQQLFFIGGCAIAVGIFTYSYKVMKTVGTNIIKLNPESALIIVISSALVLFLFASQALESTLLNAGLPSIPLVPVSSSQAVVGAIVGIGLVHGGRGMNFAVLGKIASGWVTTPVIAGLISLVSLFFLQNVFLQKVYNPVSYRFTAQASMELHKSGFSKKLIQGLSNKSYDSAEDLNTEIKDKSSLDFNKRYKIINTCRIVKMRVDIKKITQEIKSGWLTDNQKFALRQLEGKSYNHLWKLHNDLIKGSNDWILSPKIKLHNREIRKKLDYLKRAFSSSN